MRDRMARGRTLGIAILAMALAALLMFSACAPATTTEEKTVEYGGIVPMTGAVAASIQIQVQATQDYIRYFNEQHGIPGVTIKFLWGDSALQLTQFVSIYRKFQARGVPIMWAMEGDPMLGFADDFADDGVAVLGSAIGFEDICYAGGWEYLQSPTMAEEFAAVAEYVKANWKEARAPKLAFVGIQSVWGDDPQVLGKPYAQSLGFEILPSEIVPYVVVDATTNLARLKAEGADFVYMQVLPASLTPCIFG